MSDPDAPQPLAAAETLLSRQIGLARTASRRLRLSAAATRDAALRSMADALEQATPAIQEANRLDFEEAARAAVDPALLDRLHLDRRGLRALADSLRNIADLPDPLGHVEATRRLPSGLEVTTKRVPLGIVGVLYESRLHRAADAVALALKAGNAVVLYLAKEAPHTAQAVAASWAVLGRAGLDETRRRKLVTDALTLVGAPPGRLEPVHGPGDDLRVFVDYAHTGDALERVLETLRELVPPGARLWCVFGCGGDKDRTRRTEMGAAAAAHADRVVLTSDNPRSEPPSRIVGDILDGMPVGVRTGVLVHIDRAVAVREAVAQASAGDVVLIAGKGHEASQVVSDGRGGLREEPFDDREAGRAAVAARRVRTGGVAV